MATKKRTYKCLICGWEGTTPQEINSMEPGNEGIYKVCPECYWSGEVHTNALIMNLEIYSYAE